MNGRSGALYPSFLLQDHLQSLRQLREEEGERSLGDEPVAGAEGGGSEWELPGAESGRAGAPVLAPELPGQRRD